jgi:hypothetical protein
LQDHCCAAFILVNGARAHEEQLVAGRQTDWKFAAKLTEVRVVAQLTRTNSACGGRPAGAVLATEEEHVQWARVISHRTRRSLEMVVARVASVLARPSQAVGDEIEMA